MTTLGEPVPYMERACQYYRALGSTKDYVWATFADVPFMPLRKPLSKTRIALITTANPPDYNGVRRLWHGSTTSPPATLHTDDLAWDKESTHTEDRESFLPLEVGSTLASEGVFPGLTSRFHSVPTDYSQRKTGEVIAPQLLERLRADCADAAILCPL